jgi:predicted DNA-binding transcriptional regulator YafY
VPRPTARVLALLEALQSGGTRTVADLAARLDVDERTVRRYVDHLRDLDVPVRTVRGRYGGYRLAPGFRMPPLMLTDDEAVAVLLGLATGRRTGTAAAEAAVSATAKLRRVLPQALRDDVDALLETAGSTAPERPVVVPEARVLLLLAAAARDRRPVAISYTGRDGTPSERTVEPYGLVAHSGRWYVTGADSAGGEVRTFRLDRITAPAVRSGTFDVPDGFDPAAHVTATLARTPWRHPVSVLVDGSADEVRSRLPVGLATVEEAGGPVRVRLRAERLDWVPALLAGLDLPFVVESPDELRDAVRALARRLDAAAGES